MKVVLGRLALVLLGLFLVMQVIPSGRSNPPVRTDLVAPEEIESILRRACYACHSHETEWPWYSRVAPVSWWVVHHVDEGRGDLNFSEWPTYDFEAQDLALADIAKQVREGEMPLRSYTLMHPEARLSEADRQTLVDWARSGR